MNETQLELTRLLGSKGLTFGCVVSDMEGPARVINMGPDWMWGLGEDGKIRDLTPYMEIIGHPATLTDFHRWLMKIPRAFQQGRSSIRIFKDEKVIYEFLYDSSLPLLSQSEETLQAILNLVKSYESLRSQ